MNFCILPAGAWGTAMAIHLARLNHIVTLVPRTLEEAMDMTRERENRAFFPGYKLDANIQIGLELHPALMETDVVIIASPTKFLRNVCREIREVLDSANDIKLFISLSKGLDQGSNRLPAHVIREELPDFPCGVLSGPSFASQVAQGKPTAISFAVDGPEDLAREIQNAISDKNLRLYTTDDLIGVSLGGALKNVYAIGSGICDGLDLGDNTKAALLTRSLSEMVKIGVALGGKLETFFGLSGFGDLVLTCTGKESRNRTFGECLARGESIHTLLVERAMTVEGYKTSDCFLEVCQERGIDAPILNEIHQVLYAAKDPMACINTLMSRGLKAEGFAQIES